MLRNAIRSSSRICYVLRNPVRPFICAFCQPGARFNSTSNVEHGTPDGESPEPILKSLRKDIASQRKHIAERKAKGKPKSKATEAKPKAVVQGKPKMPKALQAARESKKVLQENGTEGMSISAAMNPRGTVVLEQVNDLSVYDTEVEPIKTEGQPAVATLSHGLDRVLFNPGVVYLQDPRSRVFNFDPYLQKIMPITEFNFDAISGYITSSRDANLQSLAQKFGKKYVGSTSSMTSALSHFHYLLSSWRPLNIDPLSKSFQADYKTFTTLSRLPVSIFLRYKGDGIYAIDADKELDGENVLSFMGRSMEKLLTQPPKEFEKYRRENSHTIDPEDRNTPDTYHYSTFGDFLMRSQLDAHDPRLPGSGMFDLKTRAVVAIRIDVSNFHLGSGYQIKTRMGTWESFEREYFDMIRAAFLKYSLQVRMGRMDGIFVAFHNTEKIFGFQYISIDEMDAALHEGPNSGIGAQEFKMSLKLFNKLLDRATERFPEKSLRIHFETRETQVPYMYMFAEPVEEGQIEEIQRGERGTLEEFMQKLKAKLQMAADGQDSPQPTGASELDAMKDDNLVFEKAGDSGNDSPESAISTDAGSDEEVDEEFLNELQSQAAKDNDNANLFGITLSTKSYVNGKEVLRPNFLSETDKWTVGYSMAEFSRQSRAWSVYNALRLRKQKAFRTRLSSSDPEQVGSYLQYIRSLAVQGREWQKKQDTLDASRERIVFESTKQ